MCQLFHFALKINGKDLDLFLETSDVRNDLYLAFTLNII